jgi:hypothetical protein
VKTQVKHRKNSTFSDPKSNENSDLTRQSRVEKNREDNNPLSPPSKRGKRTQFSESIIFDKNAATDYWKSKGRADISLADTFDEFKNYCLANGKTYQDWDRAWQQWYTRQVRFQKKQDSVASNGAVDPLKKEALETAPNQRTKEQWKLLIGTHPKVSWNYWSASHGDKPATYEDMVALYA